MASSGSPVAAGAGDAASPYVSKTDLIDWVNGVLQLQLTKLEQVGGVVVRSGGCARVARMRRVCSARAAGAARRGCPLHMPARRRCARRRSPGRRHKDRPRRAKLRARPANRRARRPPRRPSAPRPQFASGAVFCQLLDAYYSNVVNINRVGGRRVVWAAAPDPRGTR